MKREKTSNDELSNYFFISVSNRENLELCMNYGLAGFTNSINGLWTYLDIEEGDYLSFLYAARVKNLYKVIKKVAYKNAEKLPPWPPVTFKMSGNTYYFPFRLYLKQERILDEPMIRPEFGYVAENLLLRGGYKKTHFQADAVTLYNVSNMGVRFTGDLDDLELNAEVFTPKIVFNRELQKVPERFYFRELILQSLIRKKMRVHGIDDILGFFDVEQNSSDFEILGEKALPEGFVDIFIKLRHPYPDNIYFLIEVKTGKASLKDFQQLKNYIQEFGEECKGGILIAREFPRRVNITDDIMLMKYSFEDLDREAEYTFEDLFEKMELEEI